MGVVPRSRQRNQLACMHVRTDCDNGNAKEFAVHS
ncbi:hypothetical protein B0G80_6844 [Paraburkholderia sp. BL6669N2]|nr:hypothetical protein B0G80_6844 [Paraburkholderia sp. BL6669N2]